MSLAVSLRSRGAKATATRTATIFTRFGATASLMERRLARYDALTSDLGIRPTWPTTACVLDRHPALLRRFAERGIELAVHGLVHGDHALLGHERQRDSISRAMALFERHGLRPTGFRGPYLRYNDATLDVLRELGVLYHSSQAVAFPLARPEIDLQGEAKLDMVRAFYSALDARRVVLTPRMRRGIVDVPVTIPDDEILVERLGLGRVARTEVWLGMSELVHRRGELFVIQLHPERIDDMRDALEATLVDAIRRGGVYTATLDTLATWWRRRSAMALRVVRATADRHLVTFSGDSTATLLSRGIDVPRVPWRGAESRVLVHQFEVSGPRLPAVSVSRTSPKDVATFLQEEGFVVETSDDASAYGAHVDAGPGWSEQEVLAVVEKAPGPLVRIGRWPNGSYSALSVTGDIDALTLRDFVGRSWETRGFRSEDTTR